MDDEVVSGLEVELDWASRDGEGCDEVQRYWMVGGVLSVVDEAEEAEGEGVKGGEDLWGSWDLQPERCHSLTWACSLSLSWRLLPEPDTAHGKHEARLEGAWHVVGLEELRGALGDHLVLQSRRQFNARANHSFDFNHFATCTSISTLQSDLQGRVINVEQSGDGVPSQIPQANVQCLLLLHCASRFLFQSSYSLVVVQVAYPGQRGIDSMTVRAWRCPF